MFALFYHVFGHLAKRFAKDLILYDVGACKSCLPSGRPDVVFLFGEKSALIFSLTSWNKAVEACCMEQGAATDRLSGPCYK
jgi:hypothetical protein